MTLEDNKTAQAFAALLPKSLTMSELGGWEKYCNTGTNLRKDAQTAPQSIAAGELMLYEDDCVVLFYADHPNDGGYKYVPIGKIENTGELAKTVGKDDVMMRFEIAD